MWPGTSVDLLLLKLIKQHERDGRAPPEGEDNTMSIHVGPRLGIPGDANVQVSLIDCDVHVLTRAPDEIVDYLKEPWRSRLRAPRLAQTRAGQGESGKVKSVTSGYARRQDGGRAGYVPYGGGYRLDASAPDGSPPGSNPDFVSQQLFVESGVDYPLLLPTVFEYGVDPEQSAALCAGVNRWLEDTWLTKYNTEGRFMGAIFVSFDDPAAAVREIETWAGHPAFRQVLVHHLSARPLGHPQYEPIWEAAARHRLPVAMHFGSMGAAQSGASPVGVFPNFVSYHSVSTPLEYSAHLVSWMCSGLFDRHPDLRFVMVEGGFLWHQPILARLARHWASTSTELPARAKDPFEYLFKHVRFCTQPIEEAPEASDVASLFEIAGAERILLYSSDYPHYDYDDATRALPPQLSASTRRRIMFENAREIYHLPATRPTDRFDLARQGR